MKLAELARVLGATCHGDQEQEITGVEGIEKAGPGQLTFVANPKYTPFARTTKAGAVLVTEDFEPIAAPTLRTANPYLAFARAIEIFHPSPALSARDSPHGGDRPQRHHRRGGAYRGVCGDRSRGGDWPGNHTCCPMWLFTPRPAWERIASPMPTRWCARAAGWATGSSCKTEPWSARTASDSPRKMAADGIKSRRAAAVILGDQVEVQANSCIDRASVGNTEIASGVKIDNLVQVGHGSTGGREYSPLCPGGTRGFFGCGEKRCARRAGWGGRP